MTTCEDDAKLAGPISMFLGVEAASWNMQQLLDAANFCKQHGVTSLFWKVFEVGSRAGDAQGLWYGGLGGIDVLYQELQQVINVVPYGFLYGDTFGTLSIELTTAKLILQKYRKLCLDMEQSYWNNPQSAAWATEIAFALTPIPGKLWLSCPANPSQAGDMPFVKALSPAVNIYMPMAYNDFLNTTWVKDFNTQLQCVQPTIDLSQEFGANDIPTIVQTIKDAGCLALSCWEYQFAKSNPSLIDSVVQEFVGQSGGTSMTEVADYPDVSQFEPNESEFECGAFAIASNHFAGAPGKGPTGTPEDVDQFADNFLGQINTQGVSIDDMHTLLHKAGMHYWDIEAINPTSDQAHDQAEIKAALSHGYPVLVTFPEEPVYDIILKANPYKANWTPSGNHIVTITGMSSDGNPFVHDTAAVQGGIMGRIAPQPRHYLFNSLHIQWATIVQPGEKPWLPAIPSGDPLSWATQASSPPPTQENFMEQAAKTEWNINQLNLPTSGAMWDKWYADYKAMKFHGPPANQYENIDWHGNNITVVNFPSWGKFETDASGHVNFYSYQ